MLASQSLACATQHSRRGEVRTNARCMHVCWPCMHTAAMHCITCNGACAQRQRTCDIDGVHAVAAPNGLWGCNGEAWDRAVPLTDFSYAGFGAGEDLIPEPPVSVDVRRDFGATGSGRIDDSAAVLKALKATQASGGVIFFPPGK